MASSSVPCNGIRARWFSVSVNQNFTAGTDYILSAATFGMSDIIPRGIALRLISGNQNNDYDGTLYYDEAQYNFIYHCKANNGSAVFQGVVFF